MNVIINSSKPPPWEDGGATIEQFQSGLVRVSQSYLVPTSQSRDFYQSPIFQAGQPFNQTTTTEIPFAGDPLIIFPRPAFVDQGNGFTKIDVTAYSRWTEDFFIESDYEEDTGSVLTELSPPSGLTIKLLFPIYRVTQTQPIDALPIPSEFPNLQDRLPICLINGNPIDFRVLFPAIQLDNGNLFSIVSRQPSVGYGSYQETFYTVKYRPLGWEIQLP
jgi:hypothetical protein